jgi:hypothetical protein
MASLLDGAPERRIADRESRLMRGRVAMEIDDILEDFTTDHSELLEILAANQRETATLQSPHGINLESCGCARDL